MTSPLPRCGGVRLPRVATKVTRIGIRTIVLYTIQLRVNTHSTGEVVVAKKPKHHAVLHLSLADLRARADRAAREGRYQQALELVKQIHKAEPTPANKELLGKTYLGRARQLRGQGYVRDAITVLQVASELDGQPHGWAEQLAEEFAACGEARRAMELLQGRRCSQPEPSNDGMAAGGNGPGTPEIRGS